MATVADRSDTRLPRLRWVHGAQGREMLDRQAQRYLGISGEEFLRRWDAGEYRDAFNDLEKPEIRRLARLIRFDR